MPWLKETLTRLENRLETLVEGAARRLVPGGGKESPALLALSAVMHANIRRGPSGVSWAPDLYTLALPPPQIPAATQGLINGLEKELSRLAQQAGYKLPAQPVVQLLADPAAEAAYAVARFSADAQEGASTTRLAAQQTAASEALPELYTLQAFLIVDGVRMFQLASPVVSIGRDPGNLLVLEDMRVSRRHAQLRLVQGRFLIFDLDSTGGTFVNGQPVAQYALSAGDVISLAGVPLVYGQEYYPGSGQTQELPTEEGK